MTAFNPATFAPSIAARIDPSEAAVGEAMHAAVELKEAAARYAVRRDGFAMGKEVTCLDIAAKLERFGSFASDAQREFAVKLIEWSKPRKQEPRMTLQSDEQRAEDAKPRTQELPQLFALMQRLSRLHIGKLTITRKNQDSLCWIKHEDAEKVVGKLTEGGVLALWQRPPVSMGDVIDALLLIEADPEAAAVLHGKASGCCALCNRDLTDPVSIERGVGPICAGKAGW